LVAYIVPKEDSCINVCAHPLDQAAYEVNEMQGELTDPIERLQFKLKKSGIRQFENTLPEVDLISAEIEDSDYLARQSYRQFVDDLIAPDQIGKLLSCLKPRSFPGAILPKYRYGSAGSLYPVQTYLYIKPGRVKNWDSGCYYYHPFNHQLVLMSSSVKMTRELYDGTNQNIFDQSAFALFLVADYDAIAPMYGNSSRDFCLLEAGYISQLLMMVSFEYGLGICPIGGMNFEPLKKEFDLNSNQEMIHSFLGGGITPEQKKQLIQTDPQTESLKDNVKSYLKQKLPDYMVPDIFVQLSELPLTNNGKIDRKALPHPDTRKRKTNIIQQTNTFESQIIDLVKQVFKLESIGINDDFFDLGANSIDMVRLFNAIYEKFQIEITMSDLFRYASVQKLSGIVQKACQESKDLDHTIDQLNMNRLSSLSLGPEEIDKLSANLDNLTEVEIKQLLDKFEE
jgi:SagB-type dehydrogenase family enzyme